MQPVSITAASIRHNASGTIFFIDIFSFQNFSGFSKGIINKA